MNCKQGDLAIVVRGFGAGIIVMCRSLSGPGIWTVDVLSKGSWPREAHDFALRPIRDSDRTDEIIERIDKPVKETT